jgi:hypothetical protein
MSAGAEPEGGAPPRADLADAVVWMGLGVAILAGSLLMDRLEDQDVPGFAAPGLLPGLLGITLLLLGGIMLFRSVRAGGLARGPAGPPGGLLGPAPGRAAGLIGLCVLFGGGLVGHGLPFWAAAAMFVTSAILFLRRGPGGEWRLGPRAMGFALAIGLGAGLVITLLFQQIFLVRLP